MKYIDAEKLKAKIRKHLIPTIHDRDYDEWEHGRNAGFIQDISIIESLQQEQTSISPNLDEAAENYYENDCPYDGEARVVNGEHDVWFPSQAIEDAFKAGAEWMAGQGKSFDGIVRDDGFVDFDKYGSSMMIPSNTSCFNNSDKVIIQIRKKQ